MKTGRESQKHMSLREEQRGKFGLAFNSHDLAFTLWYLGTLMLFAQSNLHCILAYVASNAVS